MRGYAMLLGIAFLLTPFTAGAQGAAQIAETIRNALDGCGEFATPGFDFRNYKDPEGVVWPLGRQQDIYLYRDVRESGGVLTVVQWVGRRRDFAPYGSRTRAGGYIQTMKVPIANLTSQSSVVQLESQGVSRGLSGVRLVCRVEGCLSVTNRNLFPADATDVRTPLAQWTASGAESTRTSSAWTFEVCAGPGSRTSRQNAEALQTTLQSLLAK